MGLSQNDENIVERQPQCNYIKRKGKKGQKRVHRPKRPLAAKNFSKKYKIFRVLYRCCLWNDEVCSQTACLCFMIQLEDVIGKAEEKPLHRNIALPSGQETSKLHILFGHGKRTFCLDRAVDAQQTALL